MRTLTVILALVLAAGGVAWWLSAAAQPVTVDSIGDENQTLVRGKLPAFAATGDTARLYAFALENGDILSCDPVHLRLREVRAHLESRLLREGRAGRPGHLHQPRRHLNAVPGHHA